MKPHEWFVEHASITRRARWTRRTRRRSSRTSRAARHAGGKLPKSRRICGGCRWPCRRLRRGRGCASASRGEGAALLGDRGGRCPWRSRLPRSSPWAAGISAGTPRALQRELETQCPVAALQDTLSIMRQANRVLQATFEVGDTRGGCSSSPMRSPIAGMSWSMGSRRPRGPPLPVLVHLLRRHGAGNGIAVDTTRPTMSTTGMPQPMCARW